MEPNPMKAVKLPRAEVNDMIKFFNARRGSRIEFCIQAGISRGALDNILGRGKATPRVIAAVRDFMAAHTDSKLKEQEKQAI